MLKKASFFAKDDFIVCRNDKSIVLHENDGQQFSLTSVESSTIASLFSTTNASAIKAKKRESLCDNKKNLLKNDCYFVKGYINATSIYSSLASTNVSFD